MKMCSDNQIVADNDLNHYASTSFQHYHIPTAVIIVSLCILYDHCIMKTYSTTSPQYSLIHFSPLLVSLQPELQVQRYPAALLAFSHCPFWQSLLLVLQIFWFPLFPVDTELLPPLPAPTPTPLFPLPLFPSSVKKIQCIVRIALYCYMAIFHNEIPVIAMTSD